MLLKVDAARLRAFLSANEDCSDLGGEEYIADLYDAARPMTLDISLKGGKAELLAAAYLEYDAEQDRWYMGEQVADEDEIGAALDEAIGSNG